jgi:hypothetical protein
MRNFLIHTTLAFLVCVVSLALSPEAQFGRSKQPQVQGTRNLVGTVVGRAFGQRIQPLEGAVVALKNTKSLVLRTFISTKDGSFHFTGLSCDVDYQVSAEYQGARSDTKTLSSSDTCKVANITLRVK